LLKEIRTFVARFVKADTGGDACAFELTTALQIFFIFLARLPASDHKPT
jgi:hypothetical protein